MADWLSFFSFLVGRIPQSWTYRVSYHIILEQAHNLHFYHHCLRKRTKKSSASSRKLLKVLSLYFSTRLSFRITHLSVLIKFMLLRSYFCSYSSTFLSLMFFYQLTSSWKRVPHKKKETFAVRTLHPFPLTYYASCPGEW